jgi:tetratricopeptide (TPR) repeat protein
MPFSLEAQLLLLGPTLFEELCGQIVRSEYPASQHISGEGGDEGIDIRDGDLDPILRLNNGSRLTIWQVKFFRNGIKVAQIRQITESFERAIQHRPDNWILCVPKALTTEEARWWDNFRTEKCAQYPGLRLEIWPGDLLVQKLVSSPEIGKHYFLSSRSEEYADEILARLNDFLPVTQAISDAHEQNKKNPKTPAAFYSGTIADWRDIDRHFDAPRSRFGQIWQFLATHAGRKEDKIPFALLTGRSGDGKSTLLMRLGAELVAQRSGAVLMHKDDRLVLNADQIEGLPEGEPLFVLIDSFTRFDDENIRGFFYRLLRLHQNVLVIGVAIVSLWTAMNLELADLVHFQSFDLGQINNQEIDEFLDKFEEWSPNGQSWLGKLKGRPREDQRRLFDRYADRQLLVALLSVRDTEGFKAHFINELAQLSRFTNGDRIYKAVIYVSAFHRFELGMPKSQLEKLLPNTDIDLDILARTDGLLRFGEAQKTVWTRHSLVAETLFQSQVHQEEIYFRIADTTEEEHQELMSHLVRNLIRTDDRHSLPVTLRFLERFPEAPVFLNLCAMKYRKDGKPEFARTLFKRAYEINSRDVLNMNAWAVLERDEKNLGDKNDPAMFTARWLFRAVCSLDPNTLPRPTDWAIVERDNGNLGQLENPAPFSSRWFFHKAYDQEPDSVYNLAAWGVTERGNKNFGSRDSPVKFTARWLFSKAYTLSPQSVYILGEWAILERDDNNPGDLKNPAEFTARWLFRKAYDISPTDIVPLHAWAILEQINKNIGSVLEPVPFSARWLFQKAYEIDSSSVPNLTAWARLESNTRNIGVHEQPAPFTARWLFRKAYALVPENILNLGSWGILESAMENIGDTEHPGPFTSRWLLRQALRIDSENSITWMFAARIEDRAGNWGDVNNPAPLTARYCYQKGCDVNRDDAYIRTSFANFEKRRKCYYRCISLYEEAARLDKNARSRCRTYCDLGKLWSQLKNWDEAHKCFKKAVENDADDAQAQALLARSYGFRREWGESQQHFEHALKLDPTPQFKVWYSQMEEVRCKNVSVKLPNK